MIKKRFTAEKDVKSDGASEEGKQAAEGKAAWAVMQEIGKD